MDLTALYIVALFGVLLAIMLFFMTRTSLPEKPPQELDEDQVKEEIPDETAKESDEPDQSSPSI